MEWLILILFYFNIRVSEFVQLILTYSYPGHFVIAQIFYSTCQSGGSSSSDSLIFDSCHKSWEGNAIVYHNCRR